MVRVESVRIDGEAIHIFGSAFYVFETVDSGSFLQLDVVVSEVVLRRYRGEASLIVEVELCDGRVFGSIMELETVPGGLPQLNFICAVDDAEEYRGFLRVSENDLMSLPNIEEGITLEEIRAVEMPNEKVTLKLNLPIDQVEWLKRQKAKDLNKLIGEFIKGNIGE